jgi:catechol 2,3-dioxygenase-like lactoylglutathione lyase family enzyme
MSIAPIAPVGPAAAALRVQVISAVETELMAVDTVQQAQTLAPDAKPATQPAPLPNPVRQAVDVARASAATRQTSLAPLFANLAEALEAPSLPAAVKAAIGQLLALRTPLSGPITAETVKQAIARSGLFLEAHLTEAESPAAPDLKSALLTLQRALTAAPAAEPAPRPHPTITAPPVRDAALTSQAPVRPTLSAGDDAGVVIQHLAREVDGAVARQVLHQLASLPDGSTTAWMFELPIVTPQGTTLAQFEIDRDGAGSGAEAADAAWRVRFSIDIEPLGPVHVHLGVKGDRAAVTVWAEREEGLERLRAQGAELSRALPADVVFHPGAPRRPSPGAGQFVDRTS